MTYTSVIVVLPLGSLAAQRVANPSAFGSDSGSGTRKASSGGDNRDPFLKSWHSATVSSQIESNSSQSRGRSSLQDDGFGKYGGADMEKGVRVARGIEHSEQRAL